MSYPGTELIELLKASGALSGASVSGPQSQVVAPAIVVRPDEPWREADRFCDDVQRYVATAVAKGATADDGMGTLYDLTSGIIAAVDFEGTAWELISVGSPVIDETTGVALLAAQVRLRYRNGAA